jgi:predicted nucleic acid-binding protein
MSDNIFIDTNILIYAYSEDEPQKKKVVEKILEKPDSIIISTQIINEFIHATYKKKRLTLNQIFSVVIELFDSLSVVSIAESTIAEALKIMQKYRYSYFDSLMLSSALEHSCTKIYTEDMHNTQMIENSLTIENPFKKLDENKN